MVRRGSSTGIAVEFEICVTFAIRTENRTMPGDTTETDNIFDFGESDRYHNFLQRKVDAARFSQYEGQCRSNEEIETEFAAMRTQAAKIREV